MQNTQIASEKLIALKRNIKESILSQTYLTPLYVFYKQFSYDTLRYENYKKNQIIIGQGSICALARILQIVQISLQLIKKNECITKRNLYYKLVNYYKLYNLVDCDLEILTLSLNILRQDLHIISSTRSLILGDLTLYVDGEALNCSQRMIKNINSFRKVKILNENKQNLFIIEKQSALYQIFQSFTMCQSDMQQWLRKSIFITSKGYPDYSCRSIIDQLSNVVQNIYYIGDQDIYGFDILLCYSIGLNNHKTLLNRIEWVDLNSLIEDQKLQNQYQLLSKEDKKKYIQIFNRSYIKNIQDYLPKQQIEVKFKQKLILWKKRLVKMRQSGKKIELESYFKFLPKDWIMTIINSK